MALNLFMLDQASRRAWRLGKREEVRIYYVAYANTAGHSKLRKLGQQSGAAAAFAGEPARGALIEHAGADKTTLARLSSLLEQNEQDEEAEGAQVVLLGESEGENENEVAEEEAVLKAVFAQRAEELRKALVRGREWLGGIQDDLAERLALLAASPTATVSVWAARLEPRGPAISRAHKAVQVEAGQQQGEGRQLDTVIPHPTVTTPVLPSVAVVPPSPVRPAELATLLLPSVPIAEPTPWLVVGSRAEVVFGRDEHIALARVRSRTRRTRGHGEPLRRHMPVSERDIPSVAEGEVVAGSGEAGKQSDEVEMPSLWDLLVTPTSGASTATPLRSAVSSDQRHAAQQSPLWE